MSYLFDFIFDLPPKTLTLLGVLLGFVLIDDLTANEQNSLGNFLMLIGQVLETSATQEQLIQGNQQQSQQQSQKQSHDDLKKEIDELKRQINILRNKTQLDK